MADPLITDLEDEIVARLEAQLTAMTGKVRPPISLEEDLTFLSAQPPACLVQAVSVDPAERSPIGVPTRQKATVTIGVTFSTRYIRTRPDASRKTVSVHTLLQESRHALFDGWKPTNANGAGKWAGEREQLVSVEGFALLTWRQDWEYTVYLHGS